MKLPKVISELFFPSKIKCIVCGAELPKDTVYGLCDKCSLSINEKFCLHCGRSIKNQADYCDYCKENSYSFDKARAPLIYENEVRTLVHRLKYGNAKYLAREMAEILADLYFDGGLDADVVTFVPMHPIAQKERGYNQAEEIAKEFSKIISVPLVCALERTKHTKHFAKMGKEERAEAIKDLYAITNKECVKDKRVILIDDVFTTGSTSNECSKLLKRAKSESVTVLTFATARVTPELY